MCLVCIIADVCCRLDDVAGQFNVDLIAAITDAVCPALDSQPSSHMARHFRGKRTF